MFIDPEQDTRSDEAKERHEEFEEYFWLGNIRLVKKKIERAQDPKNPFPDNEGT
jgi:hypothetical protein